MIIFSIASDISYRDVSKYRMNILRIKKDIPDVRIMSLYNSAPNFYKIPIVLVGVECEREDDREVSAGDARRLAGCVS